MAIWTFVRHGQSEANRARRFAGHIDAPLSELGVAQARAARGLLREIPFDRVLTSDLARARDTARILCDGFDVPIEARPALRERHCGVYEGRPYADAEVSGDMARCFHAFDVRPEGGESLADVAARTLKELRRYAGDGGLLVVCHGALMRAVVGVLDGIEPARVGLYAPRNLEFITRRVDRSQVAEAIARMGPAWGDRLAAERGPSSGVDRARPLRPWAPDAQAGG